MAGISINLSGNFGKLDELKDKAGKTADSIKKAFGSNVGKSMFAGVSIAAAAAFAGVVAAVKSAIDAGGELQDMMNRTGAAGKGLVIMQKAFENAGIAAAGVPAVLNRMQKALAGLNEEGEPTNEAFKKLGLSVGELQAMDPVAAFQAIQAAISGIPDPAQRAAVAMELFGKSGGELLAVFQDSEAFSQAETQVGSLGQTLADNAADLDAVGDAFGSLETKFQQIGAEVAIALLPQLIALGEWLNETDFAAVGAGIGTIAEGLISLGSTLAEVAKYMPLMIALQKFADLAIGTEADPEKAKAMAAKMADPNYKRGDGVSQAPGGNTGYTEKPSAPQAAGKSAKEVEKETTATERAAQAAKKKADADRESAAEKAKSRAAAMDEYNVEAQILSAKLAGDQKRIAMLEREKKIREEMKRLESAGFTAGEARAPAAAKVDAEAKIAASADAKQKALDEKKRIAEILAGRMQDVQGRQRGQQFQSTIGAASSMQRIGGGGGAVSSGLDYARQAADLQREANDILREIAAANRQPLD